MRVWSWLPVSQHNVSKRLDRVKNSDSMQNEALYLRNGG
jgi:hypothetical protein